MLKSGIVVVLVAVIFRYLYSFLVTNGIGVHHNKHYPGECRVIPNIQCGSEQIAVTKDGLAFITNGFKGFDYCNKNFLQSKIYLFDFNSPEKNALELNLIAPKLNLKTFEPHGMDILEDGETVKLFVVNHGNIGKESIEKFLYKRNNPTTLIHLQTIQDKKFICLNDVTVINEEEFYVTNWIKTCSYPKFVIAIEYYFRFATADVVRYKNGETYIAAMGSGFNGITKSSDHKQIVVASSSTFYIHVFDRQSEGLLLPKKNIFIGHSPDNVYRDVMSDTEHVYYAGVFKNSFQMLAVGSNRSTTLYSSAVRIKATYDWSKVDVQEIFHDNGDLVKGVSVAVQYKDQYLFGTVFHKLAHCIKT